jgi:16S rRNA (cytosine967-C5)-methyltransferase
MVRTIAWNIIQQVFRQEVYSNIALSQALKKDDLSDVDQRLCTQLVYGVIHHQRQLDYFLRPMIEGKKITPGVRYLLQMSLYQRNFMDKIPEYAIVNEAVNIAKTMTPPQDRFVNAVLRNIKDNPDPMTEIEEYSVSEWLLKQLKGQYPDDYPAILRSYFKEPKRSARFNPNRMSLKDLERQGFLKSTVSPVGVIYSSGNIAHTDAYKRGYLTIQDEASQLVALALDPQPGERVLDMCAAPGGKATHLAEILNNTGEVVANDLHAHKCALIEESVKRLNLSNVTVSNHDALRLSKIHVRESFDHVLLDAPCTGWGVIGRKPEIKYFTNEQKQDDLIALQAELLKVATFLLKVGGRLVYSTCTLNKGENEVQIKRYLQANPNMECLEERTILPHTNDTDGFYIATLRKRQR